MDETATEPARNKDDAPPPKKRRPPVLLSGQVVTEIIVKVPADDDAPGAEPIYDDMVLRIKPFSRTEEEKYHAAIETAVRAAPEGEKVAARNAVRVDWFAPRIVAWNVKLLPQEDAPDADINKGTVALLPMWALPQIEVGMCGEAGRVVGN